MQYLYSLFYNKELHQDSSAFSGIANGKVNQAAGEQVQRIIIFSFDYPDAACDALCCGGIMRCRDCHYLIKAGVTQLFEADLTFQAENNSSASRVVINRPFGPASSKSLIFVSKHATEFGPK